MKTKALLLIIIFTISSYPQESILYWKLYEIFIGIQNLKENFETPEGILNEEVRFEMTGIGIR